MEILDDLVAVVLLIEEVGLNFDESDGLLIIFLVLDNNLEVIDVVENLNLEDMSSEITGEFGEYIHFVGGRE